LALDGAVTAVVLQLDDATLAVVRTAIGGYAYATSDGLLRTNRRLEEAGVADRTIRRLTAPCVAHAGARFGKKSYRL
jgi:hypothetical protein